MMKNYLRVLCSVLIVFGNAWMCEAKDVKTNAFDYVLYTHSSLSNVACRLSGKVRLVDKSSSLDEEQLIWCSKHACAVLGLKTASDTTQAFANAVGIKMVLLDPNNTNDSYVVWLKSCLEEEINRKIRLQALREKREKLDVDVRLGEFKSLLCREHVGPIHFEQSTREKVLAEVFEKVNHRLRDIDADFGLSYVHETLGPGFDKTLYTFDIPALPIVKVFDVIAEKIECTVTNRYGCYEFKSPGR